MATNRHGNQWPRSGSEYRYERNRCPPKDMYILPSPASGANDLVSVPAATDTTSFNAPPSSSMSPSASSTPYFKVFIMKTCVIKTWYKDCYAPLLDDNTDTDTAKCSIWKQATARSCLVEFIDTDLFRAYKGLYDDYMKGVLFQFQSKTVLGTNISSSSNSDEAIATVMLEDFLKICMKPTTYMTKRYGGFCWPKYLVFFMPNPQRFHPMKKASQEYVDFVRNGGTNALGEGHHFETYVFGLYERNPGNKLILYLGNLMGRRDLSYYLHSEDKSHELPHTLGFVLGKYCDCQNMKIEVHVADEENRFINSIPIDEFNEHVVMEIEKHKRKTTATTVDPEVSVLACGNGIIDAVHGVANMAISRPSWMNGM